MATQRAIEKENEEVYFKLQMELEEKRYEYKLARRPLSVFRNLIILNFLIAITAIIIWEISGNDVFITGWCQTALWITGVFTVILTFHFFNIFYYIYTMADDTVNEFGFAGIEKIKQLNSLREEVEVLEIQSKIVKTYQTQLSIGEQFELYKDELRDAIQKYQRQANRNRSWYFTMQMIIIACSLFVGSLTSGLTSFISILGNHWIAPAFSFMVSFLTAMVTLFKPREKSYNLQQTADAIEYEISCSNKRIYGYEGLDDRQAYTKLAQEVEKMRNEQRKRQQQLEQSSDAKIATE